LSSTTIQKNHIHS